MVKMFAHYFFRGFGPRLSYRLARHRMHECRATEAAIATKRMRENAQRG